MARIKVHVPCQQPLSECGCPPDDDEPDGPAQDDDGEDEAAA